MSSVGTTLCTESFWTYYIPRMVTSTTADGGGGAVARWWCRGTGRCSRSCIRHANTPSRWRRTTPPGAGVGGGESEATSDHVTSWARSRRHSGVWMGRCADRPVATTYRLIVRIDRLGDVMIVPMRDVCPRRSAQHIYNCRVRHQKRRSSQRRRRRSRESPADLVMGDASYNSDLFGV